MKGAEKNNKQLDVCTFRYSALLAGARRKITAGDTGESNAGLSLLILLMPLNSVSAMTRIVLILTLLGSL